MRLPSIVQTKEMSTPVVMWWTVWTWLLVVRVWTSACSRTGWLSDRRTGDRRPPSSARSTPVHITRRSASPLQLYIWTELNSCCCCLTVRLIDTLICDIGLPTFIIKPIIIVVDRSAVVRPNIAVKCNLIWKFGTVYLQVLWNFLHWQHLEIP